MPYLDKGYDTYYEARFKKKVSPNKLTNLEISEIIE